MTGLLEAALAYRRRGLSIIPIKHKDASGKQPACKGWKKYQTKPATEAQLKEWFAPDGMDGLAVVLGKVSGDLAARDFDEAAVYEQWRQEHPDLASTLPTVRTARGVHVYFRSDRLKSKKTTAGELRGEGNYVLLPPSKHPTGAVYAWVIPFSDGPVPKIDPVREGLFNASVTEAISTESCATHINSNMASFGSLGSIGSVDSVDSVTLEGIIAETLPKQEGQRETCIFQFARGLKFELKMDGRPVLDLKPIFRRWHNAALPNIRTKPFDDSWAAFLRAWSRARYPLHVDMVSLAVKRVRECPPPEAASEYDSQDTRSLVSLVHHLAALCDGDDGEGAFFLSYAQIEGALGIHRQKAYRLMEMLVVDGLLGIVRPGTPGPGGRKGSATRWRYTGNHDDSCGAFQTSGESGRD